MYKKIIPAVIRLLDSSSNILEHQDLSQSNELFCPYYPLLPLCSGSIKT